MTPYKPKARGQGRGNSGIYHQGRYETQVLDSFGLAGKMNETGGIYSIAHPTLNMCLPPLSWQTYDVDFTAAELDDQEKIKKHAHMTVKHNGVEIHRNVKLTRCTAAAGNKNVNGVDGIVYLQDHGNPVVFRNFWIEEK